MIAENRKLFFSVLSAGGRHQPYYHVLVDHRDRPFQSTYVAQENIVRPTPTPTPSTPATSRPDGEASEVIALLCFAKLMHAGVVYRLGCMLESLADPILQSSQ